MRRLIAILLVLFAIPATAATITLQNSLDSTGRILMQNAQTTGNGDTVDAKCGYVNTTIYVSWNGATSAGAVVIETADSATPVGWALLATVTYNDGKPSVVHFVGPLNFVRARISTTVVGGTVTVSLRAKR